MEAVNSNKPGKVIMNANIDFSLPEQRQNRKNKHLTVLIVANLIATTVLCALAGVLIFHESRPASAKKRAILSADAAKDLAVTLEQRGLPGAAANAWKDYLHRFSPAPEEAAKIWFEVGKLLQEDHKYGPAIAAFYRSERIKKIDAVSSEIGRRIAECYESLGKFSDMDQELADRVGMQMPGNPKTANKENSPVAAEIGTEKITVADIDRMIEKQVDEKLAGMKSLLSPKQFKEEKETLLSRLITPANRKAFLQRFLGTELLYREARTDGLDRDPEIKDRINGAVKNILASAMVEKACNEAIHIMPDDIDTFYQAHRSEYRIPAAVKISEIIVQDEDTAKKVRTMLGKGASFETLAEKYSIVENLAQKKGEIDRWIEKSDHPDIPGLKAPEEAAPDLFSAKSGDILEKNYAAKNGVCIIRIDDTRPERVQTKDEVKDRIYSQIYAQKKEAVQKDMINQLINRYDVVIHSDVFKSKDGEKDASSSIQQTKTK